MWGSLLRYKYQDYELSDDRKLVLNHRIEQLLFHLGQEILMYSNQDGILIFTDLSHDFLTTASGKERQLMRHLSSSYLYFTSITVT